MLPHEFIDLEHGDIRALVKSMNLESSTAFVKKSEQFLSPPIGYSSIAPASIDARVL